MIAIESANEVLNESQAVQLMVWSVNGHLKVLKALRWENLYDLSSLSIRLGTGLEVEIYQEVFAEILYFLGLTLNGNAPKRVQSLDLVKIENNDFVFFLSLN